MSRATPPRIGLALAGGGPLGAVYEIGTLCALEEALVGMDFTALDGYVGVSAGSFIAAGLANGMSPRQLCAAFIESTGDATLEAIDPAVFVRPAWAEFGARAVSLPRLVVQAISRLVVEGRSVMEAVEQLGRALPTGMFSTAPVQRQMARLLSAPGRSDDFRRLTRRLVVVATDLDSGDSAPFGMPGWDHVPISQAVAASGALPGLFPPVPIGRHWYVDGALKKTLHARVLLDLGLDLMLCLNPLVPFDASHSERHRLGGIERIPHLVEGGLPVVMSQTFRSLIHSRLELGIQGYETSHPDTDILLFEPNHRDPEMFLANIFSYSQRRRLAEHAYQRTRTELRSRRTTLRRQLARHGIELDDAVLDDPKRHLLRRRTLTPRHLRRPMARSLQRLDEVLDDLELALAAG